MSSLSENPDTIVALATPDGESAIAVVRMSGPLCEKLIQDLFPAPSPVKPRMMTLGYYKDLNQHTLDHLLYVYYPAPHSYTGEGMIEFFPHGNPFIIHKIREDLLARGCRHAQPGEFTRRAFESGKLDLSQAEAVAEIIGARSQRALESAQKRLSGALGDQIQHYIQQLLHILAQLEAYIDFPEEDIPREDEEGPRLQLNNLINEMKRLQETGRYHDMLNHGVKTMILGEPNAGKSSLLNVLLGNDRALVSEEPGTTRDLITENLMIGPHQIRIMDTAGLRKTESKLEKLGVEKTIENMREADFFLFVLDATCENPSLTAEFEEMFHVEHALIVENKNDLPGAYRHDDFYPEAPHIPLSATKLTGLDELRNQWMQLLDKRLNPAGENRLTVSARHAEALDTALEHLKLSAAMIEDESPTELIASEINHAIHAMGEIAGPVEQDRMLDELFANFCIGK